MAFLVLIIAVLSRLAPHMLHQTGSNVTLVGAGLLFFGSRLRAGQRWQALLAVLAMAVCDWYLTTEVYGYPFHLASYAPSWIWYGAVVVGASGLLYRRHGLARVAGMALATSTGFFVWSNALVWLRSGMYPHDGAGLAECYTAALPFYRNELASTLVFSVVFFALPKALALLTQAAHKVSDDGASAV